MTTSSIRRAAHPIGEVSLAVIALTNAARVAEGREPLNVDPRLHRAAWRRARHLATTGVLSHSGWDVAIEAAGYPEGARGENVGVGQPDAAEIVSDWLASEGHRHNIMSRDFVDIGASWAADEDGRLWWVQCFGSP